MWEVDFKRLLSFLHFVCLVTNPMPFKKLPLQKATLDNAKGPSKKNKSNANLFLFLLQLYHIKVYHILADQTSRRRWGQLLKLSQWKVLVGYPLFFWKSRLMGYMFYYQRQILSWTKTIGKTKIHYDTFHEIGNKWHFRQHVYFNIWLMISLSTSEYNKTFLPYWFYHLL
jgi:hypothetical protein